MKQRDVALIPLSPNWKPEEVARLIEREAETWWQKGWVFLHAETDGLLESVMLHFEREMESGNGE